MKYAVTVIPKSSRKRIEQQGADRFKIWVTAAPIDGKANAAVIEALAEFFSVPKSSVRVVRGVKARKKIIEVSGR